MYILHAIKLRKANCTDHILRRKRLLKHVTERTQRELEDEEQEVGSYSTVTEREDTGS